MSDNVTPTTIDPVIDLDELNSHRESRSSNRSNTDHSSTIRSNNVRSNNVRSNNVRQGGPARSSKLTYSLRKLFFCLLAAGVLLGTVVLGKNWLQERNAQVVSNHAILNAKTIKIGTPFVGTIAEVFVKEGRSIQKGDPLVRMDTQNLESKICELAAEMELVDAKILEANAKLKTEKVDATIALNVAQSEMEICQQKMLGQKNRVPFVRAKLDRAASMNRSAVISVTEFEESKMEFSAAIDLLATQNAFCRHAKQKLALAKSRLNAIDLLNGKVNILKSQKRVIAANMESIRKEISRATLRAPYDSIILSQKTDVGSSVRPSDTVLIIRAKETFVEAWIDESQLSKIDRGSAAKVFLNSQQKEFAGQVVEVLPISNLHEFSDSGAPTRKQTSLWLENSKVKVKIRLNGSANLVSVPLGCSAKVAIEKSEPKVALHD